jgi:autotransporter-associated beta strand protein
VESDRIRLYIDSTAGSVQIASFEVYADPNLAATATASASSNSGPGSWGDNYVEGSLQWGHDLQASRAMDGAPETYWRASGQTAGAWLEADFARSSAVDRVVLQEVGSNVTGFKIQAWNGVSAWTDIAAGTTIGSLREVSFPELQTTKLRLLITAASSAPAIAEFSIYDANNLSPIVGSAAAANPGIVTGTTTNLSVLGVDAGGEAGLTYTWAVSGPGSVNFSSNGSNASKSSTATFSQAGYYTFTATIANPGGYSTTSSINVLVNQTASTISLLPSLAQMYVATTLQFFVQAKDQFGMAITSAPAFAWSTNVGSINGSGLLTAPAAAASGTVTVTSGSSSGTASVTVFDLPPHVVSWQSAEDHGSGMGEADLTVTLSGAFDEPRSGGIHRLLVTYDLPVRIDKATVHLAGNGVGNVPVSLSTITARITLRGSSIVVIEFSQTLPDIARYAVRLDGVTDASGVALGGVNQRQLTALKGDADGDSQVTKADGVYVNQHFVSSVNPFNSTQVRSDYNQDGAVNVADMSNMWANRYHDASGISNPTIAAASPSPPAAETIIDGTTVVLTSADTLGPAGISLTVRNGGILDLGETSQSVGELTLLNGTISNGTLNANAFNLSQGTISTNLAGQGAALIKSGLGIAAISGVSIYSGGTIVRDGTLIIANQTALPDGGDLVVGDESLFAGSSNRIENASLAAPAHSPQMASSAVAANASARSTAVAVAAPSNLTVAERVAAITRVSRESNVSPAKSITNRTWLAADAQFFEREPTARDDDSIKNQAIDLAILARNS